MSNNKSYRNMADIQSMGERQQLVPTEYTDYDEYLKAQKKVNDHFFNQPAVNCELCGYPMNYNGHKPSEKELKWSVHDVCKTKMYGILDRESGVARERREVERRADRHRHR